MSLFDKVSNFTYNSYFQTASNVSKSLERISTGLRRPTAADGAALNAMAQEMEQKIRGSETIRTYLQTYDSFALTQDEYLQQVGNLLDDMTELASASIAGSSSQRVNLNLEYQKLASEIGYVMQNATFNGTRLFSTNSSLTVRLGMRANQTTTFSAIALQSVYGALSATATSGGSIDTLSKASAALGVLSDQVNAVNYLRTLVGAHAGIVERSMSSIENMVSNLESAAEVITNIDLAKETSEYVKETTILDSASAAIIQANGLLTNVQSILNTLK